MRFFCFFYGSCTFYRYISSCFLSLSCISLCCIMVGGGPMLIDTFHVIKTRRVALLNECDCHARTILPLLHSSLISSNSLFCFCSSTTDHTFDKIALRTSDTNFHTSHLIILLLIPRVRSLFQDARANRHSFRLRQDWKGGAHPIPQEECKHHKHFCNSHSPNILSSRIQDYPNHRILIR